MNKDNMGALPSATGLSQAEPQEGLGPSGFDPSRTRLTGRLRETGAMLAGWGESDFANAAAGEFGEDLLNRLTGLCLNAADEIDRLSELSGIGWAYKEAAERDAARLCPCTQPRPEQYPVDQFTEVSCRHGDSAHGVRTFIPRPNRKDG